MVEIGPFAFTVQPPEVPLPPGVEGVVLCELPPPFDGLDAGAEVVTSPFEGFDAGTEEEVSTDPLDGFEAGTIPGPTDEPPFEGFGAGTIPGPTDDPPFDGLLAGTDAVASPFEGLDAGAAVEPFEVFDAGAPESPFEVDEGGTVEPESPFDELEAGTLEALPSDELVAGAEVVASPFEGFDAGTCAFAKAGINERAKAAITATEAIFTDKIFVIWVICVLLLINSVWEHCIIKQS